MKHEFIGLQATVIDSQNMLQKGLIGKIVDETKNTITIKTPKGYKKLIKSQIKIKIMLNDEEKIISMNSCVMRPEERLKKINKNKKSKK